MFRKRKKMIYEDIENRIVDYLRRYEKTFGGTKTRTDREIEAGIMFWELNNVTDIVLLINSYKYDGDLKYDFKAAAQHVEDFQEALKMKKIISEILNQD